MVIQVNNYVGGQFLAPQRCVDVIDYAGKNLVARVPDADSAQIRSIRRSIGLMQANLKQVSLTSRMQAVGHILEGYLTVRSVLLAACALKGTPVAQVEASLQKLHHWVQNLGEFLDLSIGNRNALSSGHPVGLSGRTISTHISRPAGSTFIALSGNMDAWEQFYILAQGILSGSHMVVRASTRDVAAHEFFKLMHQVGYSNGGQLITWDSSRPDSLDLSRMILKMCPQAILFGSNKTIASITQVRDDQGNLVEDLSDSVRIAIYGTGLPVVIVTQNADLDLAARLIMQGAIEFRGAHCVSTSPVFVHKSIRTALRNRLLAATHELRRGDPLASNTDLSGYGSVELQTLDRFVASLSEESSLLAGDISQETHSVSPFILDCVPRTSRLLREEIVGPVIGLVEYDDLDGLIQFANGLATERGIRRHILTVVYGNEDEAMRVRNMLSTYVVRQNVSSSDQDLFLPHQGTYFIRDMLEDVF